MVEPIEIVIRARELPGRTFGPYRDVEVGVQVGKETIEPIAGDARSASWRVEARAVRGTSRRLALRGPAIHGRGDERFLYLVWRARGETRPEMFRRAKLQLDAVSDAQLAALGGGQRLVAELGLTDACGGPLCASVRPPAVRWSIEPARRR